MEHTMDSTARSLHGGLSRLHVIAAARCVSSVVAPAYRLLAHASVLMQLLMKTATAQPPLQHTKSSDNEYSSRNGSKTSSLTSSCHSVLQPGRQAPKLTWQAPRCSSVTMWRVHCLHPNTSASGLVCLAATTTKRNPMRGSTKGVQEGLA
jgi:hypothetical protein